MPDYLDALPEDPFAEAPGRPLIYRVDDGGRNMLYSLGPNLTDNGGQGGGAGMLDADHDGDLVFLPRP